MFKVFFIAFFFFISRVGFACDLCAIYSSEKATSEMTTTSPTTPATATSELFRGGVVEQFTHFGTLKDGGQNKSNETDQYINSSVTQIYLAYQATSKFSVQAGLPIMTRTFQRPNGFATDRGTESGIGDAAILGQWAAYRDLTYSLNIFGGIKFPTGNSSRLSEEAREPDASAGAPDNAVGGHDLALGSGSYDGILGATAQIHSGRFVLPVNLQYSLRTEGSFGYRFANDFTWQTVPSYYLLLQHEYATLLGISVSGEMKGNDSFRGNLTSDTGIAAIYIGPQVSATLGEKFSAMIGLDLPILQNETSLQLVPDSRVRAMVSAQL